MRSTWSAEVELGDGRATVVRTDGVWSAASNLPFDSGVIADELTSRPTGRWLEPASSYRPSTGRRFLRTVVEGVFPVHHIVVDFEEDECDAQVQCSRSNPTVPQYRRRGTRTGIGT